jgi:dTDP-4-dehydrorhamnose reductase
MKIFLTGGTGQVGFELQRSLALFGAISAPNSQELDLSDPQATAEYINKIQPDLIVNAAAWTAVDAAEIEHLVNTLFHRLCLPGQWLNSLAGR